jgi:hypothetical protein
MNRQTKGELKRVGGIVLLVVSTLFWLVAFRFVSFPVLIVAWILFVKSGRTDLRLSMIAWAVWVALTFSPIDVFPIPKWGRPRLVPFSNGPASTRNFRTRKTRRSDFGWGFGFRVRTEILLGLVAKT